jgi:addiction module HigA family antidote
MRKRPPTHPGAILREDVLPSLEGQSVTSFARALGVSRQTLHSVLAERSGISAEMALRLGALLGNGAQLWVDMQSKYDLWQAQSKLQDVLERMKPLRPPAEPPTDHQDPATNPTAPPPPRHAAPPPIPSAPTA